MMKKGFFSHQLCYGHLLLCKHIIYLTNNHCAVGVEPFRHEVSMTQFCEGILLAVAPGFIAYEADFCQKLRQQLFTNSSLTVGEAILQNHLYATYAVADGEPCMLYAITSVDWSTHRLKDDEVKLTRVV